MKRRDELRAADGALGGEPGVVVGIATIETDEQFTRTGACKVDEMVRIIHVEQVDPATTDVDADALAVCHDKRTGITSETPARLAYGLPQAVARLGIRSVAPEKANELAALRDGAPR